MNIKPDTLLRHYEIASVIGRGGMGIVYKARDTRLDRDVAVKVLYPHFSGQKEYTKRFFREAQAVARIDHSNVVKIYEIGQEDDETCFIVMEFIDGRALSDMLEENMKMSAEDVLNIAIQVASGLECTHEQGVYHRDIKPGNIMITGDGAAKILDFGLARVAGLSALTLTGNVMGTIDYIAPEQVLNEKVDHRSDLYSFGVVLYEMLTGQRPFSGHEAIAVIYQHINDNPVPPSTHRPGLQAEIDQLVLTLLAKQSSDRYQSTSALLTDLNTCRDLVSTDAGQVTIRLESHPVQVGLPISRPHDEFHTILIGRTDEQERLQEAVKQALAGQGRLTLLAGNEGTGKTRLAIETLEYADTQGMWTLFGSCLYHEMSMPYHPFVEALSQRLSSARPGVSPVGYARLRSRILEETPDVAVLMPHIWTLQERRRLEERAPVSLNPEAEQQRLFQSIMYLMLLLAEDRGVVLCMDDLHWGDSGSVQLLHYLTRQLAGRRLYLLATYRPEEVEGTDQKAEAPLAETLRRMNSEGLGETIALSNLDETGVRTLVHEIVGSRAVPVSISDRVYRESGGNPLFVIEVLKWWRDKTKPEEQDPDWTHLEQIVEDEDLVPPRINDLIERRLSRLQDTERELLEVAAVGGTRFDVDDLASVTGTGRMDVLRQLDRLRRRQGIILHVEGGTYRFSHGKIQDVLYHELPEALRQAYHAAWGQILLTREQAGEDVAVEMLATHLYKGGDEQQAIPYLKQAAEHAKQMSAFREARKYWEQVDAALAQQDAPDTEKTQIEVDLKLGWVYYELGDLDDAINRYKKVFGAAKQLGDMRAQADSLMALGILLRNRNQWNEALKLFEQSLLLYTRGNNQREIAVVHTHMGTISSWRGQWATAKQHYQIALEIMIDLDEIADIASITSNLGNVALAEGEDDAAIKYYEMSAQGHQQTDNILGIAEVDANLGMVYERTEQWEEALRFHKESVELFERMGNSRNLWNAYVNYARMLARISDLNLAEEICQKAKEILIGQGNQRGLAEARRVDGLIASLRGEWKTAIQRFDESEQLCQEARDPYGHGETLRERAFMLLRRGDAEQAVAVLQQAEQAFLEIGAHGDAAIVQRKLDEIQNSLQVPE